MSWKPSMHLFERRSSKGTQREAEDENDDEVKKASIGSKVSTYLKDGFTKGQKEAIEAQRDLKHTLGLGHRPSVIPHGKPDINGEQRTIELGWHPVAGATGKWFAEKTIIGNAITQRIGKYPDPTQHWAVIVGDYVHQLWMDESLNVIYINEELKRSDWKLFEVGKTKFNDQALQQASRMTIHNMREKRKAYNLISNNCQNFAVNLLDAVQLGAHREFATSFAIYQRATGDGTVMDLYKDKPADEQASLDVDESELHKPQRVNTVQSAQNVMNEHTTELDDDHD